MSSELQVHPVSFNQDCNSAPKDSKQAETQSEFLSRVPRPWFKRDASGASNVATAQSSNSVVVEQISKQAETQPQNEETLSAVVSVKKGTRGCAIVFLRDLDVLERCVLQKVAVIDGICVEIKRHEKKQRVGEEQRDTEPGVFVAWGIRVERRVTVSEEGIEAYFNSLAGKAWPGGLVAQPPFAEAHQNFLLRSETAAVLLNNVTVDDACQDRILLSAFCQRSSIEALWQAKGRLDDLWNKPPPPLARSVFQRVARAELFPHSDTGGKDHDNRAGDKLAELSQVVGLLDGVPPKSAFLDLCGGPGAWSQHLLGLKDLDLRGFGFTLAAASGDNADWQAQEKDEWYEDLYQHPHWTDLWGEDETGDLLKPANLEHAARTLRKHPVMLCVADGGFSDKAIPANQLELYFYRLFLGELLMAVSCLKPGGKFVCKLYTTFSAASASLLYLTTRMFESVRIVKPMSSRATGPERYLFASGFREDEQTAAVRGALSRAHHFGDGRSPLTTPLLTPVVCMESVVRDDAFARSMTEMVTRMCDRQATGLSSVVDRAEFLEDMAMASAVERSSHWYEEAIISTDRRQKQREEAQKERESEEGNAYNRSSRYGRDDQNSGERWNSGHRRAYGGSNDHWNRGSSGGYGNESNRLRSVPTPSRAVARYNNWGQ